MENSKEIFFRIVERLDNLKISQKAKQSIIDDIIDLVLQAGSEKEIELYKEVNDSINKRLTNIEEFLKYDIQNVDCDVEVKCPYCNKLVEVYMNKTKMDVKCPSCGKTIELEWSFDNKK